MVFTYLRRKFTTRSDSVVCFIESYNEFDTYAGLLDRLCRDNGLIPHFIGQRDYDPSTHHLAPYFKDRHAACYSSILHWGLWSEHRNPNKAVYKMFADAGWSILQKANRSRLFQLNEAGLRFILTYLRPKLVFMNERGRRFRYSTDRPTKLMHHQPTMIGKACHAAGVPLVSIVAGSNMFVNDDFFYRSGQEEEVGAELFRTGEVPNGAKALFVATSIDFARMRDSYPKDRIHVTGSLRFNHDWITRLSSEVLSPAYVERPALPPRRDGVVRVALMMTPEKYRVDAQKVSQVIEGLASQSNIDLIVKPHTRRQGADGIDEREFELEAVRFDSETHSAQLIEWSDICICYGSSVCLQVVMQGKPLVDLAFAHPNVTAPMHHDACWAPSSVADLVNGIEREASANFSPSRVEGVDSLKRHLVYADKNEPFDVLGRASELAMLIREQALREMT